MQTSRILRKNCFFDFQGKWQFQIKVFWQQFLVHIFNNFNIGILVRFILLFKIWNLQNWIYSICLSQLVILVISRTCKLWHFVHWNYFTAINRKISEHLFFTHVFSKIRNFLLSWEKLFCSLPLNPFRATSQFARFSRIYLQSIQIQFSIIWFMPTDNLVKNS